MIKHLNFVCKSRSRSHIKFNRSRCRARLELPTTQADNEALTILPAIIGIGSLLHNFMNTIKCQEAIKTFSPIVKVTSRVEGEK